MGSAGLVFGAAERRRWSAGRGGRVGIGVRFCGGWFPLFDVRQ